MLEYPLTIFDLVFIISIFGGLGGLSYALASDDCYSLSFHKWELNSGIFGHMFIGTITAFVLVAIAVKMADFDLCPLFNDPCLNKNSDNTYVNILLYLISISILGGFSGIKLLANVDKKVLEKINQTQKKLDQTNKEVINDKFELFILRGKDAFSEERYNEAMIYCNKAIKINKKSFLPYALKARIYKFQRKYKKALKNVEIAIKLDSKNTVKAHLLWNRACYRALAFQDESSIKVAIKDIKSSIKIAPDFKKDICEKEEDFQKIRDTQEFKDAFPFCRESGSDIDKSH